MKVLSHTQHVVAALADDVLAAASEAAGPARPSLDIWAHTVVHGVGADRSGSCRRVELDVGATTTTVAKSVSRSSHFGRYREPECDAK
ncbi:hypothetical protein IWX63_003087 [Arthrobacter sp. CAN_A2]